ncbi:MAG: AAA family ATPase [Spirosomaceae bacterium]|jgi:predicted ATPase|nr:AAA family ATPase [Spirosomataceae bacterium]
MTHLKGFGLENFRVFKEHTWFDFAPITLLIGPNSSGKSSLNKGLLLAKDNYDKKLLLVNQYTRHEYSRFNGIDFTNPNHGLLNIERVISDNSGKNYFSIQFPYMLRYLTTANDNLEAKLKITYGETYRNDTKVNNFPINVAIYIEDTLLLSYGSITEQTGFYFDTEFFFSLFDNYLDFEQEIVEYLNHRKGFENGKDITNYRDLVYKGIYENKISNDEIAEIASIYKNAENFRIIGSTLDKFIEPCGDEEVSFPEFDENGNQIGIEEGEYQIHYSLTKFLREKFKLTKFQEKFIQKVLGYISFREESNETYLPSGLLNTFSFETKYFDLDAPLYYLPTNKGILRRTYSSYDDNILSSLILKYHKNKVQFFYEGFVNKWAKKFKIQNDLEIINQTDLDVISVKANEKPLVELGYGISQITTLLLAIQVQNKDSLIVIEEPEANLHPAFQSKLADMFYDAHKTFNQQFILETHSEYMVRKFQYLVAKGEMKKEDVVIYYFHDPNNTPEGEKQVKKIEILEDGSLSDDFGTGFFDEAANWELELLRLKKNKTRQN